MGGSGSKGSFCGFELKLKTVLVSLCVVFGSWYWRLKLRRVRAWKER